jgi:ribosomal protein L20
MRVFAPFFASMRTSPRTAWLAVAAFFLAAGLWMQGPIAQWANYHAFADDRAWLGVPNAANVLSNLPFLIVGAMLGQMILDGDRTDRGEVQSLNQIRQELVLTAGRHDAELGYQLLRSTQQQPAAAATAGNPRQGRQLVLDQGNNLEQSLLATIAASDPKFAYQKTMESLDKGEFPTALNRVLSQLQTKDPELFKKLADKTLTRLASDSLLASREATGVAMNLLLPGPRATNTAGTAQPATASSTGPTQNVRGGSPVLSETAYHDLMDQAISAALSATSAGQTGNPQRGGGAARVMRSPGQQPQQQQTPPDDAQVRQNNARTLLFSLQGMLPTIDQYNPDRAAAVRQKLTDLGVNNNNAMNFGNQMRTAMQQGTSESLMTAASTAPPQAQSIFYQQAAQKAIDEGNTDRATQIANDHLNEAGKKTIMQAIDFKRLTTTASAEKLNEIKQKLAALPTDSDRVKYLLDLAGATQKDNPKLALRFLDEAGALVAKRAMNYKDFEDQIKVAHAYATVDAKRSFQILDAGIAELNELLAAATVLNGFEVDIFKNGEMSSRSDSDLVGMVLRFSGELGSLSKVDFDGAHLTADKFQLPEARMTARLAIVQSVMGVQPAGNVNRRGQGQNFQFFSR